MNNDANHSHSWVKILATLVILLAVVVAGVIAVMGISNRVVAPNVSISGTGQGEGAGIYIPSNANLKASADKSKNIVFYSQAYPSNAKATQATVALTSSSLTYVGASSAAKFEHMLQNKDSNQYKEFLTMANNFILNESASGPTALDSSTAAGINPTLSNPVSFTNKKINDNAWEFDYTLARTGSGGQSTQVNGKFIYVFGYSAYYRLLISSVSSNWQANQKNWDQITSSLQVNQ